MLTRAFRGPRELWVILKLLSLLPGIFHCITHRIWHTHTLKYTAFIFWDGISLEDKRLIKKTGWNDFSSHI